MSLPTSEEQAGNPSEIRLPQNPNRYQGPPTRYGGSFSAGWYTSNGYPVTGPPWSQLVAYDLNDGTIKWRVADGTAPGVVGKVKTTTGTVRPQNSPVVTAGGLVFLANSQDRFLRAFDKATGELRLGARAGGESRRHAGRLPGERTAVHRVRGWRVMGNRRRSGVEKSAASQRRKNRSAGVSRVRAATIESGKCARAKARGDVDGPAN